MANDDCPGFPRATPDKEGFTTFRGETACTCLAKWLPVYERLLLARGLIKSNIDILQLTGNAPASACTHRWGGAFDIFQTEPEHVAVAREMGAPATWIRLKGPAFDTTHTHGVLNKCEHNEPARYQVEAQAAGFNGLGAAGKGGRDPHRKPRVRRTWEEGITWAEGEIKRIEEEDMPTPKEIWEFQMQSPTDGTQFTAQSWLVNANVKAGKAMHTAEKALAEVAGLKSALEALVAQPDITVAQIEAAAKAGAKAALDGATP
ncbi:hypothetical protein ACWEOW_23305 [Monashia sp. NPDC004114]